MLLHKRQPAVVPHRVSLAPVVLLVAVVLLPQAAVVMLQLVILVLLHLVVVLVLSIQLVVAVEVAVQHQSYPVPQDPPVAPHQGVSHKFSYCLHYHYRQQEPQMQPVGQHQVLLLTGHSSSSQEEHRQHLYLQVTTTMHWSECEQQCDAMYSDKMIGK